jgi:assimilatory nitrate reductase catalytic subunit
VTYPALVTEAIRPDTVFVPYHWAGAAAANVLTVDALHPLSKIPEYKVCACRIELGEAATPAPPPPLAPGQAIDATAERAAADDRPPSAPQGRGTGQG